MQRIACLYEQQARAHDILPVGVGAHKQNLPHDREEERVQTLVKLNEGDHHTTAVHVAREMQRMLNQWAEIKDRPRGSMYDLNENVMCVDMAEQVLGAYALSRCMFCRPETCPKI